MKKWFLLLSLISLLLLSSCSSKVVYHNENIYEYYSSNNKNIQGNQKSDNKKIEKFIHSARSYIGTPYKFGGNSKKGIDCSGLIYNSYLIAFNKKIPRNSYKLYKATEHVQYPKRGDLIFFRFKFYHTIDHVGIYLGNQKFIHSSSTHGVIISKLNSIYNSKLIGFGRLKI